MNWSRYLAAVRTVGACTSALVLAGVTAHLHGAGPSSAVTSQLLVPMDPMNPLSPAPAPTIFSDAAITGSDTYLNGVAKVASLFQRFGDWDIDTTSSPSRAMWLDLADPQQPFNQQYVHSWMITHCNNNGLLGVAALMGVGSTTTCPMTFRINWGANAAVFYRIEFNSFAHPGTGDITFTCNAVAADNRCTDWSGRPADNDAIPGDGRSTGRLVQVSTARTGAETVTFLGYYQVAFAVHLMQP